MVEVRRFKYFMIAAIVCVVLLCAALVSVSFASWTVGGNSASAEVAGNTAPFYVEYPQYVSAGNVAIPVLEENKYYLQVPQQDDKNISDYYEMEEADGQYGGKEQTLKSVYLHNGDTIAIYKGTTKSESSLGATYEHISASDDKYTIKKDGYFDFYYKHDGDKKVYVDYTAPSSSSGGSSGVDTSEYPYNITFTFSFGDPVSFDDPVKFYFKTADNADAGCNSIEKAYMHSWSVDAVVNAVGNIKAKNNGTVGFGRAKTDVKFMFGFGDTNNWYSYQSKEYSFSQFTEKEYLITLNPKYDTDIYYEAVGSGGGTTATITPAEPVTSGATNLGGAIKNDLEPVRYAVMHNDDVKDEAKGGYVYRNYVSISRKNSANTIHDNSIAFVEFGIYGLDGKTPLDGANRINLVSFNWTRVNTDSKGTLTSGIAETSPRIYNYDYNQEGEVKLSDVGPGVWHSKEAVGALDPIDESKHMVEHFDNGMYSILFFGDNEQQYYALKVEIVTEEYVPDFALVVSANNINRWQRYSEGYGKQWGFYMGGFINGVMSWDPRRTTEMTGTPEINGSTDTEVFPAKENGKTINVYYPKEEIDYTLTINLTAGSLVKPYMLDKTGYRRQTNGIESDAATAYLLPKKIIVPDELESHYDAANTYYNTDASVDDLGNLNLRVPITGAYTFRLKGKVSPKHDENGGWYINLVTGKTAYYKKENPPNSADWYGVPEFNFLVDELYISTVATEKEYTVTFNSNGGSTVASQTVKFGQSVTEPDDPTKPDCTFKGWYTENDTKWNFESGVVTSNITLYAEWGGKEFDVTFDANEGKFSDNTVTKNVTTVNQTIASANIPTPTRDGGWSFVGWSEALDGAVIDLSSHVYSTQALYAQWTKLNADGVYVKGVKKGNLTKSGTKYTAINVELQAGDEIEFWCDYEQVTGYAYIRNGQLVEPDGYYVDPGVSPALGDMTGGLGSDNKFDGSPVKAVKSDVYSFYYETDENKSDRGIWACYGGTLNTTTDGVYNTAGAERKAAFATGTGENKVVANGVIIDAQTTTLTVKFNGYTRTVVLSSALAKGKYNITYDYVNNTATTVAVGYTITLNANGGTLNGSSTAVTNATTHKLTLSSISNPTRPSNDSGKSFDGWYTEASGGTKIDANTEFDGDTTIYAQWFITVTFNTNGGTPTVSSNTRIKTGGSIGTLVTASGISKTGYTFVGWKDSESNVWISNQTVTQTNSFTLNADWSLNTYNLYYPNVSGNYPSTYNVEQDDIDLGTPTPPTGKKFVNWTKGQGGDVIANNKITPSLVEGLANGSTINIYANFIDDTITVTFNANNGTVTPTSATVNSSGKLTSLPTPTRANYAFTGWYTATTNGEKITLDKVYTTSTEIYAQWTKTYYYITSGGVDGVRTKLETASISTSEAATGMDKQYKLIGKQLNKNDKVTFYVDGNRLTLDIEKYSRGIDLSTALSSNTATYAYITLAGTFDFYLKHYNNKAVATYTLYGSNGINVDSNSVLVQFGKESNVKTVMFTVNASTFNGASDIQVNIYGGGITTGGGATGLGDVRYIDTTSSFDTISVGIWAKYGGTQNWCNTDLSYTYSSQLSDGYRYTIKHSGWAGDNQHFHIAKDSSSSFV